MKRKAGLQHFSEITHTVLHEQEVHRRDTFQRKNLK